MPEKIDMIMWSKGRPLQLDYLLRSAEKYFKNIGKKYVILSVGNKREYDLYAKVFEHNSGVNVCVEHHFQTDILRCLLSCDSVLVLGNSDDNVFIGDVPDISCLDIMDESVAFSLRLHPRIGYCAPAKLAIACPGLLEHKCGGYFWDWRNSDPAGCWGYPHPCDSNVYRRDYWMGLIDGLKFKNPGTMEDAMNTHRNPAYPMMQCAKKPSLINICNNRVQATSQCPHGGSSAKELMDKMEQGWRISLETKIPEANQCHVTVDYEFERFEW